MSYPLAKMVACKNEKQFKRAIAQPRVAAERPAIFFFSGWRSPPGLCPFCRAEVLAKAELSFLVADCQVRPTRNRIDALISPLCSQANRHKSPLKNLSKMPIFQLEPTWTKHKKFSVIQHNLRPQFTRYAVRNTLNVPFEKIPPIQKI